MYLLVVVSLGLSVCWLWLVRRQVWPLPA